MKHLKKLLLLAAVLTLVVALSGCIFRFAVDCGDWLRSVYVCTPFTFEIYVTYSGMPEAIIDIAIIEVMNPDYDRWIIDLLRDPDWAGGWITRKIRPGAVNQKVYSRTYHFPPGSAGQWQWVVYLKIETLDVKTYPPFEAWGKDLVVFKVHD